MKWTKISAIIGTVLLVAALIMRLTSGAKELVHEQEVIKWDGGDCEIVFIDANATADEIHVRMNEYGILEISEPNDTGNISIVKNLTNIIPTWPDYIELEKDLVIGHRVFSNPDGSIGIFNDIEISKGTKIYFK